MRYFIEALLQGLNEFIHALEIILEQYQVKTEEVKIFYGGTQNEHTNNY